MTPGLVWLGVVTFVAVLKIVFAVSIFEEERLKRAERRKLNSKKPSPPNEP
jgi:hypothetical protein